MMEPEELVKHAWKANSIKGLIEEKRFYEDEETEPPAS